MSTIFWVWLFFVHVRFELSTSAHFCDVHKHQINRYRWSWTLRTLKRWRKKTHTNCASGYLNYDIIKLNAIFVCITNVYMPFKKLEWQLFVLDLNSYLFLVVFFFCAKRSISMDFTISKTSAILTYVLNRTFKHTPCAIYNCFLFLFLHTKACHCRVYESMYVH